MDQKIAITGGHSPALALIKEIRKDKNNWQIVYFGRKYFDNNSKEYSLEYKELSNQPDIRFVTIKTGKWQRYFSFSAIKNVLKIPLGFVQAFYWLIVTRPKLIISFGGYLSVPVIVSGWFLGIPSLTHEQTRAVGLANRINSLFVKKFAVAFPDVENQVLSKKLVLTGNPITLEGEKEKEFKENELYQRIKKIKKPILFITGGKTGSKLINQVVVKAKERLKENFFVLHQIGSDEELEPSNEEDYISVRSVEDILFHWLLSKSQMVISRAGANSVWRLASLKKKAVLIPLFFASGDEQLKNAEFLEAIGLAKIIPQKELTADRLLKTVIGFDKEKIIVNYPPWWSQIDPKKATEKVWQLAKSLL